MRYVSGLFYALAIAGGSGELLNSLMNALCVFVGTVSFLFALEGILRDIVHAGQRRDK